MRLVFAGALFAATLLLATSFTAAQPPGGPKGKGEKGSKGGPGGPGGFGPPIPKKQ